MGCCYSDAPDRKITTKNVVTPEGGMRAIETRTDTIPLVAKLLNLNPDRRTIVAVIAVSATVQ